MLQKGYTVDFLTKKRVPNNGEIPQYYVENSHPAIIEPDEFDAVQVEIERRKNLGRPASCTSPFSARLICEDCGGYYGSVITSYSIHYTKLYELGLYVRTVVDIMVLRYGVATLNTAVSFGVATINTRVKKNVRRHISPRKN